MQGDRVFIRYALGGETAPHRRHAPGGEIPKYPKGRRRLTRFDYGLRPGTVLGSNVGAPEEGQPEVEVIRQHQRPDLWETLPRMDERTRVFVPRCSLCEAEAVLMTAKGAWSWLHRPCPAHAPRRHDHAPLVSEDAMAAYLAHLDAEPPTEVSWAVIWPQLSIHQRRALHYWEWSDAGDGGPGSGGSVDGAWRRAGFPSRQAFNSAGRGAEVKLTRLLAAHYAPKVDYSVWTGGRRGIDARRFWDDFRAWGDGHQVMGWPTPPPRLDDAA
jgi:hypothetical protein